MFATRITDVPVTSTCNRAQVTFCSQAFYADESQQCLLKACRHQFIRRTDHRKLCYFGAMHVGTLRQRFGEFLHQRMHSDSCCPNACSKVHILLGITLGVSDNHLTRLHLIHLQAQLNALLSCAPVLVLVCASVCSLRLTCMTGSLTQPEHGGAP